MDVLKTIPIQEGNECAMRFLPVLVDGTKVPVSSLTNIVVTIGRTGGQQVVFPHTVVGDYVQVILPADQPRGVYDLTMAATIGDRPVRDSRKAFFSRVQYDEGIPYKEYVTKFVIIGQSNEQIAELAAQLVEAIQNAQDAEAAAEEAKRIFEEACARLVGVALESTSQEIKGMLENLDIDLQPVLDAIDDAKEEILAALTPECSDEDIDAIFQPES